MKTCRGCGQAKPLTEFSWKKSESRHSAQCKSCHVKASTIYYRQNRDRVMAYYRKRYKDNPAHYHLYQIAHKYGITPEQYSDLLAAQKGVCAMCGEVRGNRRLAVDHDHLTGQIRGLLCQFCNRAVGLLRDDPLLFRRGAAYLDQTPRLSIVS